MTRNLEIGPGPAPVRGFEGYDANPGHAHRGSASHLPFDDGTFDHVYSAHCIEHVEWNLIEQTFAEWVRVLKPGGRLTVHTVDSAPIMREMLAYEDTGECGLPPEKFMRRANNDRFLAWQGRILNFVRRPRRHEEHRTIFTPRYLRFCFDRAGLVDIQDAGDCLGENKHKPVNMGFTGVKPC